MKHVAVLDIGKTNVKLSAATAEGVIEETVSTGNDPIPGPPYLHPDEDKIEDWFLDQLRALAQRHPIGAVVATSHGSLGALIGGDRLQMPLVDYENEPSDEVNRRYAELAGSLRDRGSPIMPGLAHLARQLLFLEMEWPDAVARAEHFVGGPQYWAWRLSGVAATELTYLGAQSHLWNVQRQRYLPIVAKSGLGPAAAAGDAGVAEARFDQARAGTPTRTAGRNRRSLRHPRIPVPISIATSEPASMTSRSSRRAHGSSGSGISGDQRTSWPPINGSAMPMSLAGRSPVFSPWGAANSRPLPATRRTAPRPSRMSSGWSRRERWRFLPSAITMSCSPAAPAKGASSGRRRRRQRNSAPWLFFMSPSDRHMPRRSRRERHDGARRLLRQGSGLPGACCCAPAKATNPFQYRCQRHGLRRRVAGEPWEPRRPRTGRPASAARD